MGFRTAFGEIGVEPVEAFIPELAVAIEEARDPFHLCSLQTTGAPLCILAAADEFGDCQHS